MKEFSKVYSDSIKCNLENYPVFEGLTYIDLYKYLINSTNKFFSKQFVQDDYQNKVTLKYL